MKIVCSFIFLLLFVATGSAQTLENDRLALVDLYNATWGPYWYINTGWNVPGSPGDSPCGWYGVTCENGRVTKLELAYNEMVGTIPSSIGNLTALTQLVLPGSGDEFAHLRGAVPSEISNLVNLEKLDLSGNIFTPESYIVIGSLTKLKYLSVFYLPNIPYGLSNLTNLEHLYIRNETAFSGNSFLAIPAYFGDFTYLKTLVIWNVQVDGPIPTELGNLLNLETLEISQSLTYSGGTTIPKSVGNLSKLKTLTITGQNASGMIPSELGNLSNLETLNLSYNKLTGPIPASIGQLTNIQTLNLSNNLLSGTIPSLSSISVAAKVYINNNAFTFEGMDTNISRLDSYSPQAKLPLNIIYNTFPLPYIISVDAGGLETGYPTFSNNNTYRYFKDGKLIATQVGYAYASLFIEGGGVFKIEVTNSLIPGLTLYSEEVFLERGPMPVTIVSFKCANEQTGNFLTWQTTSETINKGFEIERSKDAINFENIGFIDGNGDSKANKDYSFLDKNPFPLTYYRLKQIDYDGKFEYSRIIYVKKDDAKLSFYPNPVKDQLFVSGLEKEENVTIHNLEGRLILNQKLLPSQPINTSNFLNGLYIIKVGEETRKVVIQN